VLAHVPSHHDHKIGEWIGIRAEVDHVVTFQRDAAQQGPSALPQRLDSGAQVARPGSPIAA
jgi:iron(III) transport system ATP-binding protein